MKSSYILPEKVTSPRLRWSLIAVLDDGASPGATAPWVSFALGRWDNDPCLAMRWNGNDENPIGNPQSRGLPTWFILPQGKVTEAILGILPTEKGKLARNFLPKS